MASKVNRETLKLCPYAEKCYRKNPIHFGEFSHPHLDKIYDQGVDPETQEYTIPDELFMSTEVIEQQLKLLEKLFPKSVSIAKKNSGKEVPSTSSSASTGLRKAESNSSGGNRLTSSSSESSYSNSSTSIKRAQPPPAASTAQNAAATFVKTSTDDAATSNISKKSKITRNIKDYIPVVLEKGQMAEKLKRAAPYNMFLTAITDAKLTHHEPLSVTLQEILDISLGEIESSVQINFMVEIGWLLGHYYFAGIIDTPLLVLYGDETPELVNISRTHSKVKAVKVNMPTPFATSHTKMMLFGYKDGSMRVVISTANLYEDDWHNRTQGVWISPQLPPMDENSDTADGESQTGFRQDLMFYLAEYKIAQLQPWIGRIRKTDFSAINVFLIASVPGGFRGEGQRGYPWGHARLGSLLQKHCAEIDAKIPIVCQSSSIGSLGANVQAWIQHDFLNSLRKHSAMKGLTQFPQFKMIYPSFGNVAQSHDGMLGGGCLPYGKNTNDKQPWLKTHLHQWCSKMRYRSQAMPHIKSYTRFNLEDQSVYWFVLTSANLSKAAWGCFNKNINISPCLRIANYEAGVLFLPRFVTGEDTFPLGVTRDGVPPFPLPYDVPLTSYGPDDAPFLMDYLR